MKETISRSADWLMAKTPVTALFRKRVDLAVLAYHGVDDRSRFATQLDHLVARYNPVSLESVLAAVDGASLPPKAVLITFDDGERTVLTAGCPELEKRGLPAVLFDVPGVLDSNRPFWWVEVARLVEAGSQTDLLPHEVVHDGSASVVRFLKTVPDSQLSETLGALREGFDPITTDQLTAADLVDLERRGVRVENHTMSHPLLDRCSEDKIADEIDHAHERLTDVLGRAPTVFAYPNGNIDERVVQALRLRNYQAAFLFNHAIQKSPIPDPLRISRLRVNSTTHINRFAAIVSGTHPAIHHLLGRR